MIHKILTKYDPKEIILKKEIQYVFVKVNSKCNARCEFCNSWETKEDILNVNIKEIISELVKINPCEVNLSGGEVFVAKYFWTLLEEATGKINWSITTNGSSMMPNVIDRLVKNNVKRLFISVDSCISEQNDRSRGIKGVFFQLCEGIKYIREKQFDIKIIINHVVTRRNHNQMGEFLNFFNEIGANAVNLIPIKDTPELYLNCEQISVFYQEIEKCFQEGIISQDFLISRYYKIFGSSDEDYESASTGNYLYTGKTECIMPYSTVFIDLETGNIYPCDTTLWRKNSHLYVMGNVNENTIDEIWNGETFERFRKSMSPKILYDCYKYCDPNNRFFN